MSHLTLKELLKGQRVVKSEKFYFGSCVVVEPITLIMYCMFEYFYDLYDEFLLLCCT